MKPQKLPEYEIVNSLLNYNPETGEFTWKASKGKRKAGAKAGYIRGGTYVLIGINGGHYPAHRLAYLLMTKEQPDLDKVVDHKNEIKSDNRWDNLQLITVGENTCKKRAPKCYQVNTRNGITWYQAVFTLDGKRHTCGIYKTPEEASKVGRAARKAARAL